MFRKVNLPPRDFREYIPLLTPELSDELPKLAADLRHLRFVHVNSTSEGGGVAEILRSLVPLMSGLGLNTDWYVLDAPGPFYSATKHIHDLLQGQEGDLSSAELKRYLRVVHSSASFFNGNAADVLFVHDPQLLPLAQDFGPSADKHKIWVCHIDLSAPNSHVLEKLLPFTYAYDALVFSIATYAIVGLNGTRVHIIPPAIDPLSRKNVPLSSDEARQIVGSLGIDTARPLVTQVSRFDMWKDPWGVMDAFRMAREAVPGLQVAFLGIVQAKDDPAAVQIIGRVTKDAGGDPDIHLIWDPASLRYEVDLVVNAFQVASQVVVQKSIREGFGLTVTEAMWKGKPVIGGNVGGIRHQISDGQNGFLVDDSIQCAQRMMELLQDPQMATELGAQARESVRLNYLLPRLLRDYLAAAKASLESPTS